MHIPNVLAIFPPRWTECLDAIAGRVNSLYARGWVRGWVRSCARSCTINRRLFLRERGTILTLLAFHRDLSGPATTRAVRAGRGRLGFTAAGPALLA